jgi:hypothetical protein
MRTCMASTCYGLPVSNYEGQGELLNVFFEQFVPSFVVVGNRQIMRIERPPLDATVGKTFRHFLIVRLFKILKKLLSIACFGDSEHLVRRRGHNSMTVFSVMHSVAVSDERFRLLDTDGSQCS